MPVALRRTFVFTLRSMANERSRPTPLSPRAREYAEIQREVQRVMISRLRNEDFRRQIGEHRPPVKRLAKAAGVSESHMAKLEDAISLLTDAMRARLMELCHLTPHEWAAREAEILQKVPIYEFPAQEELLVADKPVPDPDEP
jgi:hypothetical protein